LAKMLLIGQALPQVDSAARCEDAAPPFLN
jgi:hypothetical protein